MNIGVVYFVQAGQGGPIKIGYTSGQPSVRVAALQTGNHVPLSLVAVVNGDPQLERDLHRRFAHLRGIGEWFKPGPDLVAMIDGIRLVGFADVEAKAELNVELHFGLSPQEFRQLVEEVGEEIVSRREYAAAEVKLYENAALGDHDDADSGVNQGTYGRYDDDDYDVFDPSASGAEARQ